MTAMTECFIDDRILLDWRARHPIDFEEEERRVHRRRARKQKKETNQPAEDLTLNTQDEAVVEVVERPLSTKNPSRASDRSRSAAREASQHSSILVEDVEASPCTPKSRSECRRSHGSGHAASKHNDIVVEIVEADLASERKSSLSSRDAEELLMLEDIATPSSSSRKSRHTQTVRQGRGENRKEAEPVPQSVKVRRAGTPTTELSHHESDRDEIADLIYFLHRLDSQPRAGTGWISPHPLSAVNDGSEPPQSHVSLETHGQGRRRLTYREWLEYQSRMVQHEQSDLHAIWADEDGQESLHSAARPTQDSTTGYLSSLQPLDEATRGRVVRLVMPWDQPIGEDPSFR